MRVFIKIAEWLTNKHKKRRRFRLNAEEVSEFPMLVKEHTIFIVRDGDQADTIIFKCACGCDADIYLNLLKDTRPCWQYFITKARKISIEPSIWRRTGCESHFIIRKSKIIWVTLK